MPSTISDTWCAWLSKVVDNSSIVAASWLLEEATSSTESLTSFITLSIEAINIFTPLAIWPNSSSVFASIRVVKSLPSAAFVICCWNTVKELSDILNIKSTIKSDTAKRISPKTVLFRATVLICFVTRLLLIV